MKNISSNFTPEEILKYCDEVPESVFHELQDRIAFLEKEGKKNDRTFEVVQEQAENARTLLEEIQYILERNTRLTDVKKEIKLAFDNSYFEM